MKSLWFVVFWIVLVLGAFVSGVKVMKKRGYNFGKGSIVQCKNGHYYTSIWIPGVSFKSARFGVKRYQKCPVDKSWSMTQLIPVQDITPEIAAEAAKFHDINIP